MDTDLNKMDGDLNELINFLNDEWERREPVTVEEQALMYERADDLGAWHQECGY